MDGTQSLYRFHPRATKPAPENAVPLPRDVRASGCPEDGKRYFFRPGEILVRRRDLDDARFPGLAEGLRNEGAVPWEEWRAAGTSPELVYPEGLSEYQRDIFDAKRSALIALAERGLEAAEVQRFVIPRLADPDNIEQDDIPDVLDRLVTAGRDQRRSSREAGDKEESLSAEEEWPVFPHIVMTGEDDDGVFGPAMAVRPLDEVPQLNVDETLGEGIRIAVIDTGVREDHVWLDGRCETRPLVDQETLDTSPPFAQLDFEAGHGTFIAGVIRQFAPAAKLVMRGVMDSSGIIDDGVLAGAIRELEEALPLHILNLSLGGYIHNHLLLAPDKVTELTVRDLRVQHVGLPATAGAIERLRRINLEEHGVRLVIVAAAGNNGSGEPFYPAALPRVIGVGALNQDFSKSIWSNHGDWVDAWEIGAEVVSSFIGPDLGQPGGGGSGREGAIWSGTSFAAPRLVGLLAAAMTV